MVGGYIIDIIYNDDIIKMHVKDSRYKSDYCYVNTDVKYENLLNLGDSIWWQGKNIYWTPMDSKKEKCGVDFDIPIDKNGYSYGFHH